MSCRCWVFPLTTVLMLQTSKFTTGSDGEECFGESGVETEENLAARGRLSLWSLLNSSVCLFVSLNSLDVHTFRQSSLEGTHGVTRLRMTLIWETLCLVFSMLMLIAWRPHYASNRLLTNPQTVSEDTHFLRMVISDIYMYSLLTVFWRDLFNTVKLMNCLIIQSWYWSCWHTNRWGKPKAV